jgi:uncharacterized protein
MTAVRIRLGVALTTLGLAACLPGGISADSVDRLIDAVRAHDARAVSTLIAQKIDVNAAQPDGATALHWAAEANDEAIASLLLAAGARVDAANDYGVTPIFLAALNGGSGMIAKLLQAGAGANTALPTGETVLMTAARTGHVDAVNLLLAGAADVNAKQSSKGQTALMWAVSERHLDIVRTLLDHGADLNAKSAGGFTALLFAAREGDVELTRLLISRGANVNEAAPDGSTPLLVATVRGQVPLALFLLDQGANPDGDAKTAGYTPLHWAATKSEGVITNDYPDAPGEWAALAGIPVRQAKIDLIISLLAHGADINARVTKDLPRYGFTLFKRNYLPGGTPFYLASLVADVAVMRLLLARGADPDIQANDGTTALMVAGGIAHADNESRVPEKDRLAAVTLDVELGQDVNTVNRGGFNLAHAASFAGLDSVIQFAADHGGRMSELSKGGQTPLGIAEGNNLSGFWADRPSTAALLRKMGARSEGAVTLTSFNDKAKSAAKSERQQER